jgi:hypothetical protein
MVSICKIIISVMPTVSSPVYYQAYTEQGAVISKCSTDTGNPSLGRILGRSVAPPHTIKSLTKRICDAEGVADHSRAELFLSCAAHSPMDHGSRISLLTGIGPGSLSYEPMALVVNNEESQGFKEPPEFANSSSTVETTELPELRYCTYSQNSVTSIRYSVNSQYTIGFTEKPVRSLARNQSTTMICFYHG